MRQMLAIISVAILSASAAYAQAPTSAPAEQMAVALQTALNPPPGPYHLTLRTAPHSLAAAFKGQPWEIARPIIVGQTAGTTTSWEDNRTTAIEVVREKVMILPGGQTLDLHLRFSSFKPNQAGNSGPPERIDRAEMTFIAPFNTPASQAIAKNPFPRGTVLEQALNHPRVAELGRVWPLLEAVSVQYDYIFNRYVEFNPFGFQVVVSFTASSGQKIGGKTIYLMYVSGLDPVQSWDRKESFPPDFKPSDILAPADEDGGGEWWQGDPATIEANKQRYLNGNP